MRKMGYYYYSLSIIIYIIHHTVCMYIHVRIAGRMCRQRHNVHPHPLLPTRKDVEEHTNSAGREPQRGRGCLPNRLGCMRGAIMGYVFLQICLQRVTQRKQRYTISKAKQRYTSGTIFRQEAYVFLPTALLLATGDDKKKTTIYDLKSMTKIHEWDHNGSVRSVCFSPDGSMLATGMKQTKQRYTISKANTKIHEWDHKELRKQRMFFSRRLYACNG